MADSLKVLGQSFPTPSVLTDLYTVPASTQTTISSIIVCNQHTDFINFSISIAVAGIADDPKQYIYYNLPLDTNDTFIATIGLSLNSTDVVRVKTDNAASFNIFGVEVT